MKIKSNQIVKTWNNMTPAQRLELICKDGSMRQPQWESLRARWSNTSFEDLTDMQKVGTVDLFKMFCK